MKNSQYHTFLSLLAFSLISCCSTEIDDQEPDEYGQYILTVNVIGGGTVSPYANGTYDYGAVITITGTPDDGYFFDRWEGSDSQGCPNSRLKENSQQPKPNYCRTAIKMDSNRNVTAFFLKW